MAAQNANRRAGDAAARKGVSVAKQERTEITRSRFSDQWLSVYDGTKCLGHVLSRGPKGVEAFDRDDNSLGNFPTMQAAADALSKVPA
jgi:hypothetical protein